MSYEGFTQYLCVNGHEFRVGVYDYREHLMCDICEAPPVWKFEVDETNGCYHLLGLKNSDGRYGCCPVDLIEISHGRISVCPHCGHTSTAEEPTYQIPPEGVGYRLVASPPENFCHAGRDGECSWPLCPQIKDGEPVKTGRHCPLPYWGDKGDL